MASLKPVIRKSKIKIDHKCTIYIRLCQDRKVTYIKTPWSIEPRFMGADGRIKPSYPGYTTLNRAIYRLLVQYNSIIDNLGPEVIFIDINTLTNKLKGHGDSGTDFTGYAGARITRLKAQKRLSYAESYQVMLTHLKRHTSKESLLFKEITVDFLQGFEHYLFLRGCKVNTIRIYLNSIRAIFNHAIDNDVIRQEIFPFRKFRIKQEQTQRRTLSIDQIRKLMTGPYLPAQQRSVDIFMLIFYLIGINLKDLLYLRPEDYRDGRVYYRRLKTGSLFSVKVFPQADAIIQKYRGEKYLLSFLDNDDSYMHYKCFLKETNKRLRIAFTMHISTYTSRYSWATMASSLSVPKDVISVALGHILGSAVTNLYIDFDLHKVDEANELIIKTLLNG